MKAARVWRWPPTHFSCQGCAWVLLYLCLPFVWSQHVIGWYIHFTLYTKLHGSPNSSASNNQTLWPVINQNQLPKPWMLQTFGMIPWGRESADCKPTTYSGHHRQGKFMSHAFSGRWTYDSSVGAIKGSTFLGPYDYCYQTFFNLYNVLDTLPHESVCPIYKGTVTEDPQMHQQKMSVIMHKIP